MGFTCDLILACVQGAASQYPAARLRRQGILYCSDCAARFLQDPEHGRQLGRAGKEHVRKHFLTPRLLRDWLKIFTDLE